MRHDLSRTITNGGIFDMRVKSARILTATLLAACASTACYAADDDAGVKTAVDAAIKPVMAKYDIPGVASGVTVGGHDYIYNYGLADRENHRPVTSATLFEVGSISKTFTVT